MTTKEAILTLKHYNSWRRGAEIRQPNPKEIGEAIDHIIKLDYSAFDFLRMEQKHYKKIMEVADLILSLQKDSVVAVSDIERCFKEANF